MIDIAGMIGDIFAGLATMIAAALWYRLGRLEGALERMTDQIDGLRDDVRHLAGRTSEASANIAQLQARQ